MKKMKIRSNKLNLQKKTILALDSGNHILGGANSGFLSCVTSLNPPPPPPKYTTPQDTICAIFTRVPSLPCNG
ncbi:hypothetical protein B0I18_101342 [Taibaiella chishuiensis]|uniref:Uncharacterized protein n=1 Tax=Taibaiella chishuiensis TaxID=1434707 RepID=A0A2P8DAH3_9BACT|nr:hypothetical protein B0I18_101342 [Taibaiella chishuiensis]